jgi:hypothetical protein
VLRRRFIPLVAVLFLAAVALIRTQVAGSFPDDFLLIASAGGIPPWKENRSIELHADGTGTCFVTRPQHRDVGPMVPNGRFKLSDAEMDTLTDVINTSGFFSLDHEFLSDTEDGTYSFLEITMNGQTNQVQAENVAVPGVDDIIQALNSMVPKHCRLEYNAILP